MPAYGAYVTLHLEIHIDEFEADNSSHAEEIAKKIVKSDFCLNMPCHEVEIKTNDVILEEFEDEVYPEND